eukprot:3582275-Amphidinium_carterae.1
MQLTLSSKSLNTALETFGLPTMTLYYDMNKKSTPKIRTLSSMAFHPRTPWMFGSRHATLVFRLVWLSQMPAALVNHPSQRRHIILWKTQENTLDLRRATRN